MPAVLQKVNGRLKEQTIAVEEPVYIAGKSRGTAEITRRQTAGPPAPMPPPRPSDGPSILRPRVECDAL